MSKKQANPGYTEALAELEQIRQQLEQGNVPVEALVATVARAKELLTYCQEKLRQIGEQLAQDTTTA